MIRLKKNINKRSLQILEVLEPCHCFFPFQWKLRGVGCAEALGFDLFSTCLGLVEAWIEPVSDWVGTWCALAHGLLNPWH